MFCPSFISSSKVSILKFFWIVLACLTFGTGVLAQPVDHSFDHTVDSLRYDQMAELDSPQLDFDAIMGEAEAVAFLGLGNSVKRKGKKLEAVVDLSKQRMSVYVDGVRIHKWVVSTGKRGDATPTGTYKPTRMYRKYYSKTYDNAPMPNSVFFYKGYAIHGSYAFHSFGRPGSHGCIRLFPIHGRKFYNLVQAHGKSNTKIRIVR